VRKDLLLLLSVFITVHLWGQTSSFEPQILILSPGKVRADKVFEKEIAEWNKNNKGRSGNRDPEDLKKQPGNIKTMVAAEVEFSKNIDFGKQVSMDAEQYLSYRFFEKFPNLLIMVKDIPSSGKIEDLRKIAADTKLQYVLSFPSLSFFKVDGISYAKLAVQFYDHLTNSLLIDTSYIGDWFNPGFEFACHDSSLSCTISNAISQALDKVIYEVASNSPTLKKERELWQNRLEVLRNEYYPKSFNTSIVTKVIPPTDSNIVMAGLYQLLVNMDSTKFVGFFLKKKAKQGLKQLYQGKWYYEKTEVTYFTPEDDEGGHLQYFNTLQDWGFFKDNSTAFSPDFWETHLFEKVRDLRKDPDWDKYGTTIWKSEEEENRKYIGLYKVVVDQLKGDKETSPTRVKIN